MTAQARITTRRSPVSANYVLGSLTLGAAASAGRMTGRKAEVELMTSAS